MGERSSGRTSGPCQDFSLPPELRCWFILADLTEAPEVGVERSHQTHDVPEVRIIVRQPVDRHQHR